MLNLGFFQILIETCKGTTIFYHVLRQSPWRALFHFLLLCFLCAVVVWGYSSISLIRGINTAYDRVEKNCGRIIENKDGVFPEKEPEKSRMVFSMPRLELTYVANPEAEIPKINIGIAGAGIVWMPKVLLFWNVYDSDKYLVYTVLNGRLVKMELIPPDRINAHLKASNIAGAKENPESVNPYFLLLKNPAVLKFFMLILTFGMYFGIFVIQFFSFVLMISLIFAALGSRRLQGKLFFRDYFVLNCYIAFPCMLISAVWLALQPPFLNFQWVAVLSFCIYFMIVMSRIERWLSPPPPDTESGD